MNRTLACLLLLSAAAHADVLHVPGEFPSIAFAVEAAAPGDTILIAAGTYDEQVIVNGAADLVLRGQGQVEIVGGPLDVGLDLENCVDTRVENLRFVGHSLALRVGGSTNVTVSRCRAEDMDELGFQVIDSQGTVFDRCETDGALDGGLELVGALGGEVRRCTFTNVGSGLKAFESRGVEVDRLRVEHAVSFGILLDASCVAFEIHHARITDAGVAGISLDAQHCRLQHDLVKDGAGKGIECGPFAARNVLDRERVTGCGGSAFVIGGSAQELLRCRALDAGDVGFLCADSGGHVLQRCRAKVTASYGILVNGNCPRCLVQECVVVNVPENGIETNGDQTILWGNRVTDAGIDGFRIGSDHNTVVGNRAKQSGDLDLDDDGEDSAFFDNHVDSVSPPPVAEGATLHVPADVPTIQAALDAAQAGDLVLVAAGSYEETVTAVLATDVTLRGQGQVVLRGGDASTPVLSVVACTRFAVENLVFDQPASLAIEVAEGHAVRLSECTVQDSGGDGILVGESLATILDRCEILRPAGLGVEVSDTAATLLVGCRVEDSGGASISVHGAGPTRLIDCRLVRPQTHGVVVESSSAFAALDSVVQDAALAAVDIGGTVAVVRGNRLLRPGDVGVFVKPSGFGTHVVDNRIVDPVDTGILVAAGSVIVRRNRVVDSTAFGMSFDGEAPAVTDNVVTHTGDDGLQLTATPTAGHVARNRVKAAGDSAFHVSGAGLLVMDNVAQGAGLDGFLVTGGPSEYLGNVAKGSGQFDLEDTSGEANVYLDNSFPVVPP